MTPTLSRDAPTTQLPRAYPQVKLDVNWRHDAHGIWKNHHDPDPHIIEVDSDSDHITAKYIRIHGPKNHPEKSEPCATEVEDVSSSNPHASNLTSDIDQRTARYTRIHGAKTCRKKPPESEALNSTVKRSKTASLNRIDKSSNNNQDRREPGYVEGGSNDDRQGAFDPHGFDPTD